MSPEILIEKIAKQELASTSVEDMVSLACAFWHEGFIPDFDKICHLPKNQLQLIGYLTEFFSLFHCVAETRAIELVNLANKIKVIVQPQPTADNPDEIAAEWGLTDNMNKFLGDILYYQTRHYHHTKS